MCAYVCVRACGRGFIALLCNHQMQLEAIPCTHTHTHTHSPPQHHGLGSAIWHSFTKTQKLPKGKGEQYHFILLFNSLILSAPINLPDSFPLSFSPFFICLLLSLCFSPFCSLISITLVCEFIKSYSILPVSRINGCHRNSSQHALPRMAIFNEARFHLSCIKKKKTQFSEPKSHRDVNLNGPLSIYKCDKLNYTPKTNIIN